MVQSVERSASQILELLRGYAQGAGAQSLEQSMVAIFDALNAGLDGGGGGGGDDPLHLDNYLSIGAAPAGSGAIRLSNAGSLVSAGDGDSAGDIKLVGLKHLAPDFDVVRIGDASGPLAGEILFDPFESGSLVIPTSGELHIIGSDYSVPADWQLDRYLKVGWDIFESKGRLATVGNPARNGMPIRVIGAYWDGAASQDVEMTLSNIMATSLPHAQWRFVLGINTPLILDSEGGVTMTTLPTADPSVAGQLWNDAGIVKVSAG